MPQIISWESSSCRKRTWVNCTSAGRAMVCILCFLELIGKRCPKFSTFRLFFANFRQRISLLSARLTMPNSFRVNLSLLSTKLISSTFIPPSCSDKIDKSYHFTVWGFCSQDNVQLEAQE